MMWGIAKIVFTSVMFIHLGLGDTINNVLRIDFVLFRCVKCLTFWLTLCYALCFINVGILNGVALAFASSYAALWIDLSMSKLAVIYEKWSKQSVVAEEAEHNAAADRNESD